MKYLHSVLTVIAFCLVMITSALLGFIPSVSAKNTNAHYASVPINPDGSITVKFAKGETMDVNIDEIGGTSQSGRTIDVNVDEVGGHSTHGTIKVEVER